MRDAAARAARTDVVEPARDAAVLRPAHMAIATSGALGHAREGCVRAPDGFYLLAVEQQGCASSPCGQGKSDVIC